MTAKRTGARMGMPDQEKAFLFIISSVLALRNLGLILVLPVLAVFAGDLEGTTPFLVGLSIGIYGLTQALFQIPFGWTSDQIGRRRVVLAGLFLFVAGNVLAGMSDHVLTLVAGRALMGTGAIASVCFAWISDRIPPERRNRSFSVVTVVASVAAFFGFLAGPILYRFVSLAHVFYGCAVLGLVGMGVLWGVVPETPASMSRAAGERVSLSGLKDLFREPFVVLHCTMGLVMNYFLTALFFAVPFELKAFIRPEGFWKIIVPIVCAGLLVLIPTSRWADRGHAHTVIAWGFAIESLAALSLVIPPSFVSLVLALFLFVTGYMILAPALPSSLSRGYGSAQYGSVMGLYSMFLFLGSFLGATISSLVYPSGLAWVGASLFLLGVLGSVTNHRLRGYPVSHSVP